MKQQQRHGLSVRRIAAGGGALVVCPCHVLSGGAALVGGLVGVVVPLAPELQDGVHALYLAAVGLGVALWLRRGANSKDDAESDAPSEGASD